MGHGDSRGTRTHIARIKSPVSYQLDQRIIWSAELDSNQRVSMSRIYSPLQSPLCHLPIWSEWCESNTRYSVPKTDGFPLAYTPICNGAPHKIRTCTEWILNPPPLPDWDNGAKYVVLQIGFEPILNGSLIHLLCPLGYWSTWSDRRDLNP